jgi:hypothetical protein
MAYLPQIGDIYAYIPAAPVDDPISCIVTSVSETAVTFVSLTGKRVQTPVSTLEYLFEFLKPNLVGDSISTLPKCSREGCSKKGFIAYSRPTTKLLEIVCPTHIPQGTKLSIITENNKLEGIQHFIGYSCPASNCPGKELFEIFDNSFEQTTRTTIWRCPFCSKYFSHSILELSEYNNFEHPTLFRPYLPPHSTFIREVYKVTNHPELQLLVCCEIDFSMNVLTGIKESLLDDLLVQKPNRSFFDYVLNDDLYLESKKPCNPQTEKSKNKEYVITIFDHLITEN